MEQPFGCGNKVIEDILLPLEDAGRVPVISVFAASSQIRHGVETTVFEPLKPRRGERRRQTDVEAAVP